MSSRLPLPEATAWRRRRWCAGGVDTREVNPDTMESLICPGIYFAGELLDIDGACGGYNLQWAGPADGWPAAVA